MHGTSRIDRARELQKLPEIKLLLRHGWLGIATTSIGILSLIMVIVLHEVRISSLPEYAWGAISSIPVTILCMGLFSVFYEYYMRTHFTASMRSIYWAWDTGVTVFPTHKDAPARREVLERTTTKVRLMSTTLSRYFTDVGETLPNTKLSSGVEFRIILYDPESDAIEEKAREEGCAPEDFRDEIQLTCRRYLGPLTKKYPNVKVKFCNFNTPFGITIIDDRLIVLSLNVFGLARSKNQTPCLVIENKYDPDSVFKLYENSFDAIWQKLPDGIPKSLARHFE